MNPLGLEFILAQLKNILFLMDFNLRESEQKTNNKHVLFDLKSIKQSMFFIHR